MKQNIHSSNPSSGKQHTKVKTHLLMKSKSSRQSGPSMVAASVTMNPSHIIVWQVGKDCGNHSPKDLKIIRSTSPLMENLHCMARKTFILNKTAFLEWWVEITDKLWRHIQGPLLYSSYCWKREHHDNTRKPFEEGFLKFADIFMPN